LFIYLLITYWIPYQITNKIDIWNILALDETGKTAEVRREMHRYNLKILGRARLLRMEMDVRSYM
jgi:hypothetical protein